MKNLITASIITTITILMLSSLAFAVDPGMEAGANIQDSTGIAKPIVKAKWETPDENSDKPWTQITSPMSYQGKKPVTYWLVATDPYGTDFLYNKAYADVTHPDGTYKYNVPLYEQTFDCTNINDPKLQAVLSALEDAYNKNLIKFAGSYTYEEVRHEIIKCSAKVYKGTADLDYHQMCGEFKWKWQCVGNPDEGCTWKWTVLSFNYGYQVSAYAVDTIGQKSDPLVNYFEYICAAGVELDFNKLDFGSVMLSKNKWIEGDKTFSSPKGTACGLGATATDCVAPTIRNIGNIPVNVYVKFDDMGFGESTDGWNVKWDARLGERADVVFDPFVDQKLPGDPLGLCNTDQISFSMHVLKPTQTGGVTGKVWITPQALSFPWWL